jgi:peroxiredoxin
MVDPMTLPDDLPVPSDDGAADHLRGSVVPAISLGATTGPAVDLSAAEGRTVVYAYPWTGRPGQPLLSDDWDSIPGARGCTPETCGFRDHHADLEAAGAAVYGLSTQDTAYQRELAERLGLPYPVLSDERLALTGAMRLPAFQVAGRTLLRRLTLVLADGEVEQVFYPVFPPDRHAAEVLAWLRANPRAGAPA